MKACLGGWGLPLENGTGSFELILTLLPRCILDVVPNMLSLTADLVLILLPLVYTELEGRTQHS